MRLKGLIARAENPRTYAVGFLVSVLAALLVLVAVAALGEYTKTRGRLLLTALLLAGYCVTSLGPAFLAHRNIPRIVPNTGLSVAGLAIILLLVGVWATPNSDGFWKAAVITGLLAATLAYASLTHWLDSPLRTARHAARVSAIAALAGMAMAAAGIAFELKTPPYWWVFTLFALLWALSGVFVPLAVFWKRRVSDR